MKATAKNATRFCDTIRLSPEERKRTTWEVFEFLECENLSAEDKLCNIAQFKLDDEPLLPIDDRTMFCVYATKQLGVYLTGREREALAKIERVSQLETSKLADGRYRARNFLDGISDVVVGKRAHAMYAVHEALSETPQIDCCVTSVLDGVDEDETSLRRKAMAERLLEHLKAIVKWRVSYENEYRHQD